MCVCVSPGVRMRDVICVCVSLFVIVCVCVSPQGLASLSHVLLLRDSDEVELAYDGEGTGTPAPTGHGPLGSLLTQWLTKTSVALRPLPRDDASVRSPLFRCLDREVCVGVALLGTMREDIRLALAVCSGAGKMTNHTRALLHDVSKGTGLRVWRSVWRGMTAV